LFNPLEIAPTIIKAVIPMPCSRCSRKVRRCFRSS